MDDVVSIGATSGRPADPLLSVRGLSVCFATHFGWVWANRDVSFDIWPGEIVALVGESGSGKSTVLRAITGLLDGLPGGVAGHIEHEGDPIWPDAKQFVTPFKAGSSLLSKDVMGFEREHRRLLRSVLGTQIGTVFQEPVHSLDPWLNVEDQFRSLLQIAHGGDLPAGWSSAVDAALRSVALEPREIRTKRATEMSGGECQRVSLAMALLPEPSLLLCDEPTTAVDVEVQEQIHGLLKEFVTESHRGVLLISHHWREVIHLADRIVMIDGGQTVEWLNRAELMDAPPERLHPVTSAWRGNDARLMEIDDHDHDPDWLTPETGCPYAGRCKPARDRNHDFLKRCRADDVPVFNVSQSHRNRCWLFAPADSSLSAT